MIVFRILVALFSAIAVSSCSQPEELTSEQQACLVRNFPAYVKTQKQLSVCVSVCKGCFGGSTTTCTTSCTLQGKT